MGETLFQEFCTEGANIPLTDLLVDYARTFDEPFSPIGEQGTSVTDDELRRWLNWCLFYGKPRDEYPLANQG